jgi:hypothetical protein
VKLVTRIVEKQFQVPMIQHQGFGKDKLYFNFKDSRAIQPRMQHIASAMQHRQEPSKSPKHHHRQHELPTISPLPPPPAIPERGNVVSGRRCVHSIELPPEVRPRIKRTRKETVKKAPRKSIRPR